MMCRNFDRKSDELLRRLECCIAYKSTWLYGTACWGQHAHKTVLLALAGC